MQINVFAQEAHAHLPHSLGFSTFGGLGAQKQRVNRGIRMPAIFQKVNGQSLWTASGKDKTTVKKLGKMEMYKEDSYKSSHKACTQTTTTQSWSSGKLEARNEEVL